MTEKEYSLLLKKIKGDLKPAISLYVKKASKKYLKETIDTLREFDVLSDSYNRRRLPMDENILPEGYSNKNKINLVQDHLKIGNVNMPVGKPKPQQVSPEQKDYSAFLDAVEKAEKKSNE